MSGTDGPHLLIDVDGWGASTVYLVNADERIHLHLAYQTMPSRDLRPAAEEWAARYNQVNGTALPIVVNDPHDSSRLPSGDAAWGSAMP